MWAEMVVLGDHGSGLQIDFDGADTVAHEQDFASAAVEDVEAAVFVGVRGIPVSRRMAQLVILQEFDGEVAKGLRRKIAKDVGEGGRDEADVAVGKREGDRWLAFNRIDDASGADRHEEVIVAMGVHECLGVRRDVDVEDADLIVDKDLVVVRLRGDLDVRLGLREKNSGQEEKEDAALHERDCSVNSSQ